MPNALLLITGIFPPDSGGPAKFAMEFGKWASTQGFRVEVRSYSGESIRKKDSDSFQVTTISRNQNVLIRYFKMIHAVGKIVSVDKYVLSIGAFLETYFASILFRFSYVVKVPGDIVWERARNNGVTKLQIEDFQNQKLDFKYRIFRFLYSRSLRKARFVIVPSLGLYKLCIRWGVSESRLRLIYNSVGSDSILKDSLSEKEFDFTTVCRLTPWKGVDELIEYVAIRHMNLLVLGDGPDKARLQSLASKLNAQVTFEGEVESHRVREALLKSRIFVLNSYYEGLPHALVEARAAGVLSVGRAGTGSEEVINDGVDGFLIRPDRPLIETLDEALKMHLNSNMMISSAKTDTLKRFSMEQNFPTILKVIQSNNE